MTEPGSPTTDDITRTLGLGHSRHRLRRWLWPVVGALVVAVIVFIVVPRKTSAVQYVTQPAQRGDLVVTVSATGSLQPVTTVDVGIEVSGTIKTVNVDYNDTVTVGQVLARLETSRLEAQLLQSEASLASARAKVKQAAASVQEARAQLDRLNRVHELSGGKMPSQSDLDSAVAALARAEADAVGAEASVALAQATVDVNRTDLSKAEICSPIAGVVLNRNVEPGQTVAASFQAPVLFTLAESLSQMELEVDVDEADVGQVKAGQDATFTVDAYPDRTFPARVTQVRFGSQTVDGVVTYKTVLKVDNTSLVLRPGMTATAIITVNKVTNALLVPNAALRFRPATTTAAPSAIKNRGLVGALLPGPPHRDSAPRNAADAGSPRQQVWVLQNDQLTSIAITEGASDGVMTEVTDGALESGTELVTDTLAAKP